VDCGHIKGVVSDSGAGPVDPTELSLYCHSILWDSAAAAPQTVDIRPLFKEAISSNPFSSVFMFMSSIFRLSYPSSIKILSFIVYRGRFHSFIREDLVRFKEKGLGWSMLKGFAL